MELFSSVFQGWISGSLPHLELYLNWCNLVWEDSWWWLQGALVAFAWKWKFFLPVCEFTRRKPQRLQTRALPELKNLEVVFIVLKIGESAKIGGLHQNAE